VQAEKRNSTSIKHKSEYKMQVKVNPRIEKLKEKKLIGYNLKMSLTNNKTGQLWGRFGPKIKEVKNRVTEDKISMQIYDSSYYQKFNPDNEFEKWATVEVEDFKNIPNGMKSFTLKEGVYAVFDYKGPSSDNSIFQYIFWEWLPNSSYQIDGRPHFEVLGENYKNNDQNSEEEIWIPIMEKNKAST
jgi:AraC family transcriptional regulator